MTITFFFNYLNHHQVLVADEMYNLLGDDFRFVATYPRNPQELKGGADYSDRPYCVLAPETEQANILAHELNRNSDVCVFGAGNLEYVKERAHTNKLSFEVGERWLKRGLLNILSPRLLKWWWLYQTRLRNKPFYKLCASAFAAKDDELLGCYKSRHYKWGYFTSVSEVVSEGFIPQQAQELEFQKVSNTPIRLMWCARLIDWKHPELAIKCAKKLKEDGYRFQLDMYGDGPLRESLEFRVESLGLSDEVKFQGNVPNAKIQEAMQENNIFLFTSDRQEGWGAVANEAMANGCCLVGSDEIGSIPYLIQNGRNGLVFKSRSSSNLYEIVKFLIDNPLRRIQIAQQGYEYICKLWCPKAAADNLLHLITDLQRGMETSIIVGPCSQA